MLVIGIDPGAKGAVCFIRDGVIVSVHDLPMAPLPGFTFKSQALDVIALQSLIRSQLQHREVVHAAVENPQVRDHGESVSTQAVAFWRHGQLLGSLLSLGIPIQLYNAGTWISWIKGVANHGRSRPLEGSTKEQVAMGVTRLFPAARALIYGPRGGLLDGRSDAIGIAIFHLHSTGEFKRLKDLKESEG